MAVPKKKKSHLKTRNKYVHNNIKNILNRKINLKEYEIFKMLCSNELDVSYYVLSVLDSRWKRKINNI
jgi:ribosomal protein L32